MKLYGLIYRPAGNGACRRASVRASSEEAAIRRLARETGWPGYLIAVRH